MAKVAQLTLSLRSRPGVLAALARTLADARVNTVQGSRQGRYPPNLCTSGYRRIPASGLLPDTAQPSTGRRTTISFRSLITRDVLVMCWESSRRSDSENAGATSFTSPSLLGRADEDHAPASLSSSALQLRISGVSDRP
jgi:hypothetical protein